MLGDGQVATAGGPPRCSSAAPPMRPSCSTCAMRASTRGCDRWPRRRLVECGAAACAPQHRRRRCRRISPRGASPPHRRRTLHAAWPRTDAWRRPASTIPRHGTTIACSWSLDVLDAPVITPQPETHRIPPGMPGRRPRVGRHPGARRRSRLPGHRGRHAGLLSAELPPRRTASLAGRLAGAEPQQTRPATLRRPMRPDRSSHIRPREGPAHGGDRHPDRSEHPDPPHAGNWAADCPMRWASMI